MSSNPASGPGGVRNLRAMFENAEPTPSPEPRRGRSPVGSASGDGSRPGSRVRASFVPVEATQAAKDAAAAGTAKPATEVGETKRPENVETNIPLDSTPIQLPLSPLKRDTDQSGRDAPAVASPTSPVWRRTPQSPLARSVPQDEPAPVDDILSKFETEKPEAVKLEKKSSKKKKKKTTEKAETPKEDVPSGTKAGLEIGATTSKKDEEPASTEPEPAKADAESEPKVEETPVPAPTQEDETLPTEAKEVEDVQAPKIKEPEKAPIPEPLITEPTPSQDTNLTQEAAASEPKTDTKEIADEPKVEPEPEPAVAEELPSLPPKEEAKSEPEPQPEPVPEKEPEKEPEIKSPIKSAAEPPPKSPALPSPVPASSTVESPKVENDLGDGKRKDEPAAPEQTSNKAVSDDKEKSGDILKKAKNFFESAKPDDEAKGSTPQKSEPSTSQTSSVFARNASIFSSGEKEKDQPKSPLSPKKLPIESAPSAEPAKEEVKSPKLAPESTKQSKVSTATTKSAKQSTEPSKVGKALTETAKAAKALVDPAKSAKTPADTAKKSKTPADAAKTTKTGPETTKSVKPPGETAKQPKALATASKLDLSQQAKPKISRTSLSAASGSSKSDLPRKTSPAPSRDRKASPAPARERRASPAPVRERKSSPVPSKEPREPRAPRESRESISSTGFVKPKPRSPTRPINLPSHLTAATASSAAKYDPAEAASGVTRKSSVKKSNPPPVSKPAQSQSTRKSISRSSLPSVSKRPNTEHDDESFLARMMRPTQSSASKVHEKPEIKSPTRTHAPPRPKTGGVTGAISKGKKKVEGVVEQAKEKVTSNGHDEEKPSSDSGKVPTPAEDTAATPPQQLGGEASAIDTPNFEGGTIR